MYVNTHRLQRGLSLVEVFVALLVLSVGLIALAKLQVDLVRGSADARARTIALSLAEEKIEDLRTFVKTDSAVAWTAAAAQSPTFEPAWSHIDTSKGGRLAPQTARQVAGVNFQIDWTVSDLDFTASIPPPLITSRTKNVTVTVSWVNESGDPQEVELLANIVEIPPGNVALASEPLDERPDGPQILYTPGEAPEVISVPINVGDGRRRETTKPLPTVQAQADFSHEVTFDVVNYHNNGTENIVDRREEFVTVNCRCKIGPTDFARTPARVSFVGGVLRDQPGQVVTKQTGVVNETGPTGVSQQPALCTLCCRDHFDGTRLDDDGNPEPARYNPTVDADHDHYLVAFDEDPPTFTGPVTSMNSPYDEACRLKRVNGVFQVFEDWNLEGLTAIPFEDLADGATTQADYIQYIEDFVRHAVDPSTPAATLPTFSATELGAGGSQQLLGRAIYIDHMPQALIDFLTIDDPGIPNDGLIPNNQPFLEFVPFFEINLTKLAQWKLRDPVTDTDYATVSGQDCDPTTTQVELAGDPADPTDDKIACIASQDVVTEALQEENYYRGLIVAGPAGGSLDAQVYARNSNTSITSTFPLSQAEIDAPLVSAEYNFAVTAAAAVTGAIRKAASNNPSGNPWDDEVTCTYSISGGGGSGSCTLVGSGNNNPRSFTISAPASATVTVTVGYSGGNVCPSGTQSAVAPGALPAFTPPEGGAAATFTIRTGACP